MNNELLIECVKRNPALYDTGHIKYMDYNYKTSIWIQVANELNQDEEACKKRWANIRDQFKRTLNKRNSQTGQTGTVLKKYKYEEMLQFLVPHIEYRMPVCAENFGVDKDKDKVKKGHNEKDKNNIKKGNDELKTDEPLIEVKLECSDGFRELCTAEFDESSADEEYVKTEPSSLESMQTQSSDPISSNARKRPKLTKDLLENDANLFGLHPIDDFFRSLSSTVKTFSPYYQHLAKGKLFAIVQELELEQMRDPLAKSPSGSN